MGIACAGAVQRLEMLFAVSAAVLYRCFGFAVSLMLFAASPARCNEVQSSRDGVIS